MGKVFFFFFQAEDGIRDVAVTGVQTCALPICREIRKREEAEDFAARGGRTELVAQNRSEREMLEAYAPTGLDAAALERVIREIAATEGGRSIGAIMTALRARHPGGYDGR